MIITVQLKYTSNFKTNIKTQPKIVIIKKQTKKKKGLVTLSRGYVRKTRSSGIPSVYNKYLKPKDKSFKVTTTNFLYGVFRSLILLNSASFSREGKGLPSSGISISKFSLFSIKSKASKFTILRAPYRYKKGRYQVGFRRYRVFSTFTMELPLDIKNKDNSFFWVSSFFSCIASSLSTASSNVVNLNKIRLLSSIKGSSFFKIKSYRPKADR